MRNEQLNNTCILFDPKDEAQQKAIIKFYNDNKWENIKDIFEDIRKIGLLSMTNCIGVLNNVLYYYTTPDSFMKVIELPSDYYPTKIVESEKVFNGWSAEEMRSMLEDVVSVLDLSDDIIEKHGPLGTPPSELVRLVLEQKDKEILMLKAGMKEITRK